MERDGGFYWVKFSVHSKWEVARWHPESKLWRFTSGCTADFCLEVDERMIFRD